MKRLVLLTPYALEPPHPRIPALRAALAPLFDVRVERVVPDPPSATALERHARGFFTPGARAAGARAAAAADVVLVQDLLLLPAVAAARARGRAVIYETLDNNVHWRFHRLAAGSRAWARALPLRRALEAYERSRARRADLVLVNSDALRDYFRGRAEVLYYASPLEEALPPPDAAAAARPPALLYLGLVSIDKGAADMAALRARLGLPLHVFGRAEDAAARAALDGPGVHWQDALDAGRLGARLRELAGVHALLGVSLVRPVHRSYATQEANKDIDYLALGVPIVGNRRGPTARKIEAGAGVFADDADALGRLVRDAGERAARAAAARRLYDEVFAARHFAAKLRRLVAPLAGGAA